MEFSDIFLPENIIFIIYNKLYNNNNNIIFSHINTYTYNTFKKINKYKIFTFTNNYKLFRQYLNIYNYSQSDINTLGLLCSFNMNTIKSNILFNYYDLRYIFELVYNNCEFDKNLTDDKILHIINNIHSCKSFNKFETILNINKNFTLYSLHYNFKPDINIDWVYI